MEGIMARFDEHSDKKKVQGQDCLRCKVMDMKTEI
jgi:hypothetical protein